MVTSLGLERLPVLSTAQSLNLQREGERHGPVLLQLVMKIY